MFYKKRSGLWAGYTAVLHRGSVLDQVLSLYMPQAERKHAVTYFWYVACWFYMQNDCCRCAFQV